MLRIAATRSGITCPRLGRGRQGRMSAQLLPFANVSFRAIRRAAGNPKRMCAGWFTVPAPDAALPCTMFDHADRHLRPSPSRCDRLQLRR
jgi:hypothetical protein